MPRQNLFILLIVSILSVVCYRQADNAHRSERGRMFDTFNEVLSEVDQKYLRKVESRQLFEGALQGMMSTLDPYSAYIGPEQYAEFVATLEQKFGGIGIEVSQDPDKGVLTVTTPIADSPAFAAGIRAGDVILSIDGESTQGLEINDVVGRLRGSRGVVQLTVLHKGETEPTEIAISRGVVPVASVLGGKRDERARWDFFLPGQDRIGYVRVTNFGENTVDELKSALADVTARDARGLILDLRNNSGGVLKQAIATCDLFLRGGRIVSTRGRNGDEIESWDASGKAPYAQLPLVVLVNQRTASAAEIVAAALQDQHRAIIVGQRTFGKGTVQNVIRLEGGTSLLKLTTASYWRPNGRDIHRHPDVKDQETWGVQPDPGFDVPIDDDQYADLVRKRHEGDVIRSSPTVPAGESEGLADAALQSDVQLQKAVAALTSQLATRQSTDPP